jgi:hypothetical protein
VSGPAQFVAAFAYEVDPALVERFEAVYGPDGEWARFFRRSDEYVGTELWRSTAAGPPRFLVIDRWTGRRGYEDFLAAYRTEYDARSAATAALYRREDALGRFQAAP